MLRHTLYCHLVRQINASHISRLLVAKGQTQQAGQLVYPCARARMSRAPVFWT